MGYCKFKQSHVLMTQLLYVYIPVGNLIRLQVWGYSCWAWLYWTGLYGHL